jgi:hypothetical protein
MNRIPLILVGLALAAVFIYAINRCSLDRLAPDQLEQRQVIHADIGRIAIGRRDGLITSMAITAEGAAQKEALRGVLSRMALSTLAAERTCRASLTFRGGEGGGELYNCSDEKVGDLRADEAGFLKDKIFEYQTRK